MMHVTQVGFLIDFNSFPVLTLLRTNPSNSKTTKVPEFNQNHAVATTPGGFSTPSTALLPSSSTGQSGVEPSTSSRDQGQRFCMYTKAMEMYNNTSPQRSQPLALESGSDLSDDEDYPGSELKRAREDQVADNLQCVKEIILERLQMASLANGKVETDNVQWSYQFFDSSQEVIKTKNNPKKFFKLDSETIESFEQILERELKVFIRGKKKLEKKRKKMLMSGENYYLPQESNRLTCLSNALKNIMSDIQWIDESGPKTTQYNNILYILHHLPSNEREVNCFANGHIPVGKSLHQKLLRDALLPPAFLQVLRDKLQIKLNFIDISNIGQSVQAFNNNGLMFDGGSTEKGGQDRQEDEMDEADRKSMLLIQKMLQMIHAKYEARPERHVIPLQFGTWYMMLKALFEGAGLRAASRKTSLMASGQKSLLVVPYIDKKEKQEKEKSRLSAESGPLPRKEFESLRRSERRREREPKGKSQEDCESRAVAPQVAEVSPTVKVGHWLGNDPLFSPEDQLESVSRDGASDQAISVDSFDMDRHGYGISDTNVRYRPYQYQRRPPQPQIEYQPKPAITRASNAKSSAQFDYNHDQDRLTLSQSASTSKTSRELLKRNSSGNVEEKERKPPNTSFIKMQNPRKPLEIAVQSKAQQALAREQQQRKMKGLQMAPFTQFESGYGTRLRSKMHNDNEPQRTQSLPLPALPEPGRKHVSAISYVAPAAKPTQSQAIGIVPIDKAASSPPNRLNVKRNLRDAFNSFSVDRGAGANQGSYAKVSASKTGSAKKRGRPPASQSRVLKSKRKLQMDDEETADTATAGPSHGHVRWGLLASALKMDQPTPTPTTPQRKKLKRRQDRSVEKDKTVVQESPQVTKRTIRTRRGEGGLSNVDSAIFYSHGSNESNAWKTSGQKLVANQMKETVEVSQGFLADLSTRTTPMKYDEFEILPSSSPECEEESNKKLEEELKYFHLQVPSTSPLVLYSTPPGKAGAAKNKDDTSPTSPCLMKHFVMPALSRSKSPKKTRAQVQLLIKEERETEGKEKSGDNEGKQSEPESTSLQPPPPVTEAIATPSSSPSSAANAKPKATPPSISTSTHLPVTPAIDGDKIIAPPATTPGGIIKITPPPRRAKAKGAASTAVMTASFSSTSSSDFATPSIDIDALVTREILNTPTPPPRRVSRMCAVPAATAAQMSLIGNTLTVSTSPDPTPISTRSQTQSGVPVSIPPQASADLFSPDITDTPQAKAKLDLFSPDMISDDDEDDEGHGAEVDAKIRMPKAKPRFRALSLSPDITADIALVVKRTPKTTAAKRKLAMAEKKLEPQTPTTPAPSSAQLSILSPSPARIPRTPRTPRNLRQFTPVKPNSGASSSSTASERRFLYSDTTPDKIPDLDDFFSKLSQGRRHRPLRLCSPTSSPPLLAVAATGAGEKYSEDVGTETESLPTSTTLGTAAASITTTTTPVTPVAGEKKKKRRKRKPADWGLTRKKYKKKTPKPVPGAGPKSDTGTDQQTDESSSVGYTPTPSPVFGSTNAKGNGMGRPLDYDPYTYDEDEDNFSASP